MELIDKAALVAEIEKRIKKYASINVGHIEHLEALYGAKCKALMEMLSFIDTLEVKEVDSLTDALIEKAWSWVEDNILSSNQQDKSLLYYERLKNYIKE